MFVDKINKNYKNNYFELSDIGKLFKLNPKLNREHNLNGWSNDYFECPGYCREQKVYDLKKWYKVNTKDYLVLLEFYSTNQLSITKNKNGGLTTHGCFLFNGQHYIMCLAMELYLV